MNYLNPAGPQASAIASLLWGLVGLSVVVVVVVSALVIAGIVRQLLRREPDFAPIERPKQGVEWIYIGVGLSTLALVVFTGWTVTTLAAIDHPPGAAPFVVTVTARQWWWQVDYDGQGGRQSFTTANEIHVPVGVPVRFRITSGDVIHSFWIPALGGKTDAIPGRVNDTWLEADRVGTYRGQCVEYCGVEHALMALTLVASPPDDFESWWNAQLAGVSSAAPGLAGHDLFVASCGQCHTVRGSGARGTLGPDLSHLMSRGTLAAGILTNTKANLAGWIANPQQIKPGAKMPIVPLGGTQLTAIVDYLETLQ